MIPWGKSVGLEQSVDSWEDYGANLKEIPLTFHFLDLTVFSFVWLFIYFLLFYFCI